MKWKPLGIKVVKGKQISLPDGALITQIQDLKKVKQARINIGDYQNGPNADGAHHSSKMTEEYQPSAVTSQKNGYESF